MAAASQDRHPESPGVRAYRIWVAVASAGMVTLCGMILSTVKETSNDVTTLKVDMSQLKAAQGHQNERIAEIIRRNEQQDDKISKLREDYLTVLNRVHFPAPAPAPPPFQPPAPPPAAVVPSAPSLRVYP